MFEILSSADVMFYGFEMGFEAEPRLSSGGYDAAREEGRFRSPAVQKALVRGS